MSVIDFRFGFRSRIRVKFNDTVTRAKGSHGSRAQGLEAERPKFKILVQI